jgi:type I restriction enzyme S subunit
MNGWTTVRLSDCCRIVSGATPSTTVAEYWDGDIEWATPKDLSSLSSMYIETTERRISTKGLQSCAAEVLPPQSVLFSSRAPIGHIAINARPMATNQGFKSFVPDREKVHPEFLYYWLRYNRARLERLGSGATFKEVSKAVVARIEISLPPLAEQKRIAGILDAAKALGERRRQAIAALEGLRAAAFSDVFHSDLASTKRERVASFVEEFRYGTSVKSEDHGLPTLRIPNVVSGLIDISDLKTVPVTPLEEQRLALRAGDVLFVRTNGNPDFVGRCAEFDPWVFERVGLDAERIIFASYLIRARLRTGQLLPCFLCAFLSSPEGRRELRTKCKTSAGQFNVNVASLGSVRVPVPSLERQQRFAASLQVIAKHDARLAVGFKEVEKLISSMQQRAFRGDL